MSEEGVFIAANSPQQNSGRAEVPVPRHQLGHAGVQGAIRDRPVAGSEENHHNAIFPVFSAALSGNAEGGFRTRGVSDTQVCLGLLIWGLIDGNDDGYHRHLLRLITAAVLLCRLVVAESALIALPTCRVFGAVRQTIQRQRPVLPSLFLQNTCEPPGADAASPCADRFPPRPGSGRHLRWQRSCLQNNLLAAAPVMAMLGAEPLQA